MTHPRSACGASPSRGRHQRPGGAGSAVALVWAAALCLTVASAHAAPPRPAALDEPALQTPKSLGAAMLAVTRAGSRLIAAGERGIVLISDDGGREWKQAQTPVQVSLTALRFADDRNGWAVGHMGVVLATSDGGLTWRKLLDGVRAAELLGSQRGIDEGADKPFFDVDASDANHAIVVGAYNLAFETSDGGKSWKPLSPRLPNPKTLHLYGVRVAGGNVYVAGEQGLLMKSTDHGATFAPLASPYKGSFFGLFAARSGTLVAYGLRGNAFRSADEGRSWDKIETGAPASISTAAELSGGALALLTQTGQVLVSRDDARTFTALALPPTAAPTSALAPGNAGTLVLASLRGLRSVTAP
jgi:photosystem II stability/assembly factor-like uncharacterized protein